MEYRHMKTPNYGVPTHENAQLWGTDTRERPIMVYQHMKTPIYDRQPLN